VTSLIIIFSIVSLIILIGSFGESYAIGEWIANETVEDAYGNTLKIKIFETQPCVDDESGSPCGWLVGNLWGFAGSVSIEEMGQSGPGALLNNVPTEIIVVGSIFTQGTSAFEIPNSENCTVNDITAYCIEDLITIPEDTTSDYPETRSFELPVEVRPMHEGDEMIYRFDVYSKPRDYNGAVISDGNLVKTYRFSTYVVEVAQLPTPEERRGCLIATASFGSPMAQEVQMLREIRDMQLMGTESGSAFMYGFNTIYYSFAPTIAQWESDSPIFKEVVKATITPLIASLSLLQYAEMDSEVDVLTYGISMIVLNIGMYFVAPAMIIIKLRKRF